MIAANPDKGKQIQGELVIQFIDWIISAEIQRAIADVGVEEYGQAFFTLSSRLWLEEGE